MRKLSGFVLLLLLLTTISSTVPVFAQDTGTLESNLTDECVTDYDANVDYFPEKVEINDALNLSVAYFNNYKVVTVTDAFFGAEPFTYVLVQCGTPAPATDEVPEGSQFVEVPVNEAIAMSTTFLPHFTELGLLDNLVGLDSGLFVNSPEVRELIDAGELVEIGSGAQVNIEVALDTDPDLILANGFDPSTDAFPILIEAGIFTALSADYREASPLGRAEWIKFTGLFFNEEAQAAAAYDEIVTAYNEALELAATVPEDQRPVVLWNSFSSFSDAWLIPGSDTYAGQLIEDAGGVIALGDEAPDGSAFLSFEVVYNDALDADIWMINAFGVTTREQLIEQDARYADFLPVETGEVWNNNLSVNENGGVNYFELGVTNPQLILQDLVAMFHPDLLPEHEFNFFRRLD